MIVSKVGVASSRVGRGTSWVAAASRLLMTEEGMGVLERSHASWRGARRVFREEGAGHEVATQFRRDGKRESVTWAQIPEIAVNFGVERI